MAHCKAIKGHSVMHLRGTIHPHCMRARCPNPSTRTGASPRSPNFDNDSKLRIMYCLYIYIYVCIHSILYLLVSYKPLAVLCLFPLRLLPCACYGSLSVFPCWFWSALQLSLRFVSSVLSVCCFVSLPRFRPYLLTYLFIECRYRNVSVSFELVFSVSRVNLLVFCVVYREFPVFISKGGLPRANSLPNFLGVSLNGTNKSLALFSKRCSQRGIVTT